MIKFTTVEKKLLNEVQKDIHVEERPYLRLGEAAGLCEEETLSAIRRFKEQKVIRQISAIFDTRSLGYQSSLVAAKVPPEKLEAAAEAINTHPGVSHNYLRNHDYNLWYTIAVPPDSRLGLQGTVELLGQLSGAQATRLLPTLKLYKIGVAFDVAGEENPASKNGGPAYRENNQSPDDPLSKSEINFILEMQEDLSVTPTPFAEMGRKLKMSIEEMADVERSLRRRGKLRRIAAVLHHRQVGFAANAMGVWAVPEARADEVGQAMGNYRSVSHCYRRPTYPDWPYNIFTMVHGKSKLECDATLQTLSRETGICDYYALYSIKEFKKTRVRYFTPETYAWETQHAPAPISPTPA